jgi:hypothetical protein
MSDEFGLPMSSPRPQAQGAQNLESRGSIQRFGRFLILTALIGFSLLAGWATSAQAATVSFYAAPAVAGTGDCSAPANACTIDIAVTNANAAAVTDSVQIKLARGNYLLSAPTPTALPVTFAGPSLSFEALNGTPTISGTKTVRPLSVSAASNVTVDGLQFEFGLSTGNGGAIDSAGALTVKNSTFSSNTAGNGGAISSTAGSTLNIQNSTFSHNSTTGVGGGAIIAFGITTITRSALINNTVTINGGGLNVQPGGVVTLSNSTIAGNTSAGLGGGMSNLGTLKVQSSTIADNTASGGAAMATGNANVTFAATIVAAQSSPGACNPANLNLTDGGYNLDSDGTCISPTAPAAGSHNGTTAYGSSAYGGVLNAYLGGLASNGGQTKTIALLNSPNPSTALANPAFDVVPPSFALPAPIAGVSAACSLADQRGVVPAAGGNCDIGAYLLQPTKTALTASAAKIGQDVSVTYTATVTPAADKGTVSFNDGAGNPATTGCPAQLLSNGTATCTVSYPKIGTYSVIATYSGDGALNNSHASASAVTTTQVVDRKKPTAPGKLQGQIQGKKLKLSWKASKDNVGVKGYQVLRNSHNVVKKTKAKARSATINLAFYGGVYAVRAVDAAGNVSPLSKKVTVRLVNRKTKTYRIVKNTKQHKH